MCDFKDHPNIFEGDFLECFGFFLVGDFLRYLIMSRYFSIFSRMFFENVTVTFQKNMLIFVKDMVLFTKSTVTKQISGLLGNSQ